MQMVTLIIAPVFITAALYMLLGQLIQLYGPESCMLSARLYTIAFLGCALVSLIIQVSPPPFLPACRNQTKLTQFLMY